jgi:hypothetical protein
MSTFSEVRNAKTTSQEIRYHTDADYRIAKINMVLERRHVKRQDPMELANMRAKQRQYARNHYHANPEYQERQRARALERYYRLKNATIA